MNGKSTMRNTCKTILALMAGTLALGACSKEVSPEAEENSPELKEMTFSFTQEDETKATISNVNVLWSAKDSISIFAWSNYQNPQNSKFTLTSGAGTKTAEFSGSAQEADRGYIALYPYMSSTVSGDNGANIYVDWDNQTQTAIEGGADPKVVLMGGYAELEESSSDVQFGKMYNLCGYVRFTVTNTCSKIVFKTNGSEAISTNGLRIQDLKTIASETPMCGVSVYGVRKKEITIVGKDNSYIAPGTYTIAVLPATLANGFTITEYAAFDVTKTFEKSTSKSAQIKRNAILNLGTLDSGSPFTVPESIDLGLPSGSLWATCNVGAESPEQEGNFYAWGYTTPIDTREPVYFNNYHYCSEKAGYTNPDPKTPYLWDFVDDVDLLAETEEGYGDAARVEMGGSWQIPTPAYAAELANGIEYYYTKYNGVDGYRLISKSNGNSIFLPMTRMVEFTKIGNYEKDDLGNDYHGYWTTGTDAENADCMAICYGSKKKEFFPQIGNSGWEFKSIYRVYGLPIRACISQGTAQFDGESSTGNTETYDRETYQW